MADMLASGVAWMANQLVTHAGQSCTYIRGGQSAVIAMRRSPQPQQTVDINGRLIEFEPIDFLADTTKLKFGTVAFTPERGDLIRCTVISDTITHEVFSPNQGHPWFTATGGMIRIRTKVVANG